MESGSERQGPVTARSPPGQVSPTSHASHPPPKILNPREEGASGSSPTLAGGGGTQAGQRSIPLSLPPGNQRPVPPEEWWKSPAATPAGLQTCAGGVTSPGPLGVRKRSAVIESRPAQGLEAASTRSY